MLSKENQEFLLNKFTRFNLLDDDAKTLINSAICLKFNDKNLLYKDKSSCYGFVIVKSGKLRGFISDGGKEITIFTLHSSDECVICSTCTSNLSSFDIALEAKENLEIIIIPPEIFIKFKEKYPQISNFVLELLAKRFTKSIQIMQQALFTPLSKRLVEFLKQNALNSKIKLTHEEIANHLGSSREAISRILKEMERQGKLKLLRSEIILKNEM